MENSRPFRVRNIHMFLYDRILCAFILLCFISESPLLTAETASNPSNITTEGNHYNIIVNVSHKAKYLQGNNTLHEIERKPRDVQLECGHALMQRAICHWRYDTDIDVTREPAVIQKAICSTRRVFLKSRLIVCETLHIDMIFRRANCIGNDCYFRQYIPVGCVAAMPCVVH
ncbi:hypothetical protein CHS0354_012902 [Potamilus streckersoni]|uniref:Uncharacterized protein n=1 Tax=Potamilus streckersoni TaxID=2493646 RepID=A0AAE0TBG8_9BIVA|nr:hypothetical protein CHS0354_012902 [Potamilus streckersoni]